MTYTIVPTITTGDLATAAWGNTHIKDNFAAGVPDLFTTLGDVAIATASNAAKRLNAFNASDLLLHEVGGLEFDASAITTGGIVVGQSAGVMGIETPMTQAQAEAGTDTQVRGVTAERLKQSIDALSSSHTEAKRRTGDGSVTWTIAFAATPGAGFAMEDTGPNTLAPVLSAISTTGATGEMPGSQVWSIVAAEIT